jgi:proline dehydrogenase
MPTERTLAQHRKRWQTAEHLLEQERTDRTAAERWGQEQAEAATQARERVDQLFTELRDLDPEARLVADLEAAVSAYERRVQEAAERAAEEARRRNPNQYAMAARWDEQVHRVGPWRPALESPLGRALLHLAARHDVAVEATVEYPAEPGPTLVSVPPHLGRAIEHLVQQDGFR